MPPVDGAGIRLSDLLEHLATTPAANPDALPDAALMELLGGLVRVLAALHQSPGSPRHGALNPAHVVVTTDGAVLLLETGLASDIEALQRNREQLWKEFGLAFPPAASLPRFDRRADVTQLAAIALALTLRRPLRTEEYPRGVADLVLAATDGRQGDPALASALRMWLQQALQLHSRANFATAAEAARALAEIPMPTGSRRAGGQAIRALVRSLTEDPAGPILIAPFLAPDFPKLHTA